MKNDDVITIMGIGENLYTVWPDGTMEDQNGKNIFFSFEKFKDEICKKGHCFVCGSHQKNNFNDEHVFPDWLLRICGIYNDTLTLPNGQRVKYSTYKIPCCMTCNSQLSDIYESKLSHVFKGGYSGVIKYIQEGGTGHLCSWLSLLFSKVHLRDFKNIVSLDRRKNEGVIGDHYDLHHLHHIHAIARAATAGVAIEDEVFGSLIVVPVDDITKERKFDFANNLQGRTLLLQVNDFALIYVMDDCGATTGMLVNQLKHLPKELNLLQIRELYVHYVVANMHILSEPKFRTGIPLKGTVPAISVNLPELVINDINHRLFGKLLASVLSPYADNIIIYGKTGDAALKRIEEGDVSFIFNGLSEI
jgi:hypothetical protein